MLADARPQAAEPKIRFRTAIISRKRDFDNLFAGFKRLRAITYVASPDLLLALFDQLGFDQIEVLVGENLTGTYKEILSRKTIETTEKLAALAEAGQLRIFTPTRSIHSKLFLLDKPGITRIIQGSANLTDTARNASLQTNYVWLADLPNDDALTRTIEADYRAHFSEATLFMGDLLDLLRREGTDRREAVEAWLRGRILDDDDAEVTRVLQGISREVLLNASTPESVISIRLPDDDHARRQTERFLEPLGPVVNSLEASIPGGKYIRFVHERYGLPLMQIDADARAVRLGLDSTVRTLTESLPSREEVAAALTHIERYIRTVDAGQTTDAMFAKTAMYEALLYMMWAPFATSYMTERRDRYGAIDYRGPRFLYLYGPAQNGKTTFLRFALKLITERRIEPQSAADFTKTRVRAASSLGTAFPLVFDDLNPSKDLKTFETVMKHHWEVWWQGGHVFPQIVISSNSENLSEWAKSRVKHIDFDVHFAPNERDKQHLAEIFASPNHLFRWFSHLYFEEMELGVEFSDDELYMARRCLRKLYEYANVSLPQFFPAEPIEKLYDPGWRRWHDVVSNLKMAKLRAEGRRVIVEFKAEMDKREVAQYRGHLPQTIKSSIKGNTIIIDSPDIFMAWLSKSVNGRGRGLARFFRRART